jgi:hypothetical protein
MTRLHRHVKFSPGASLKMRQQGKPDRRRVAGLAVARYRSARFLIDQPESGAV